MTRAVTSEQRVSPPPDKVRLMQYTNISGAGRSACPHVAVDDESDLPYVSPNLTLVTQIFFD